MRIQEIAAGLATLAVASSVIAGNLVEVTPVADTLVPIDNPATNRWPKNAFARGVLDLQFYHGRLFGGGGETETNPGPTWIHSIDPDLLTTKFEYSAGTEAIANFMIASWGDLYTPAQDPREGDRHEGSVFKRTEDGVWSKHGGIPGGNAKNGNSTVAYSTHVWDMAEFDGRIFTTGYGLCWSTNRFASFVDASPTWTNVHQSLQCWPKANSANKTTLSLLRRQVHFLKFPGDLFAVPNTWADAYQIRETRSEVHHYNLTTKTFDAVPQYASTLFPGISLSDFGLVFPAGKTATTNGYVRVWHPTSFKDRVLYVTSLDYQTPAVKGAYALTSYPLPLFGCTAKVSNGKISASRLSFDGEYPWDFLVRGGTVCALTSKYVADGKKARHSVWKSTDGQNFTRLFTFDYHQHFISLEYRDGWFYFGAGVKSATKGDTYDSQADESGLVCRAWHPMEPFRVIASKEDAVWNEGATKTFGFRLSSAPSTNLTLRVVARGSRAVTLDKTELTFTPSNWSAVQTVQATLVNDAANDSSAVAIVCGAKGDDIELGELASPEVTGACVRETPADDDVAPAVTSESFAYAAEPVTYAATLGDFGCADGFAATSATLVGTVYGDAARTNVIVRQEKTISATGVETTLAFDTLTRGAAGYFVAELKTLPTIVREFTASFIAPLGTASDLTDLMDDLMIRGENLSANGTTGDTNGSAAYDNNVTGTGRAQFGGYNKPAYFVYNFTTPQVVNGFGVMSVVETSGNPDRHPNSINLYGSSDGSTWTKLFAAPTQTDWTYSEWRRFTVPNETAYAYYKLEIASGIQWTLIQEAELYHVTSVPEAGNGEPGTGTGGDDPVVVPSADSVRYVSTSGNDAADGLTESTAKATVGSALDSLVNVEGGVVVVTAGSYSLTATLTLEGGVRIVGATGRPEDVVLHAANGYGTMVVVNDARSGVESCSLVGGGRNANGTLGGAVRIGPAGGTVSNCVISSCYAGAYGSKGGGAYLEGASALMTHCVVTNCTVSDENAWGGSKACGVQLVGGARLENSLVANCRSTASASNAGDHPRSVGGILAAGASSVLNCTVVDCRAWRCGGVHADSTASVRNTAIAGCSLLGQIAGQNDGLDIVSGAAAAFDRCATDGSTPINASCVIGTTGSLFVNCANGDYRPAGALVNAGVDGDLPATDLAGRNRKVGSHVDIGCYESQARVGLAVIFE